MSNKCLDLHLFTIKSIMELIFFINLLSLYESYIKVGLSYREIFNLLNDKGCRSNNGNLCNRMSVNIFMYKFRNSSKGILTVS